MRLLENELYLDDIKRLSEEKLDFNKFRKISKQNPQNKNFD